MAWLQITNTTNLHLRELQSQKDVIKLKINEVQEFATKIEYYSKHPLKFSCVADFLPQFLQEIICDYALYRTCVNCNKTFMLDKNNEINCLRCIQIADYYNNRVHHKKCSCKKCGAKKKVIS